MSDGWNLINFYFRSYFHYLSIVIHFTHFYCIGGRFGAFSGNNDTDANPPGGMVNRLERAYSKRFFFLLAEITISAN